MLKNEKVQVRGSLEVFVGPLLQDTSTLKKRRVFIGPAAYLGESLICLSYVSVTLLRTYDLLFMCLDDLFFLTVAKEEWVFRLLSFFTSPK